MRLVILLLNISSSVCNSNDDADDATDNVPETSCTRWYITYASLNFSTSRTLQNIQFLLTLQSFQLLQPPFRLLPNSTCPEPYHLHFYPRSWRCFAPYFTSVTIVSPSRSIASTRQHDLYCSNHEGLGNGSLAKGCKCRCRSIDFSSSEYAVPSIHHLSRNLGTREQAVHALEMRSLPKGCGLGYQANASLSETIL